MIVLGMLCLASVLLFTAIMRRDQPLLLMGVVAYAATCLFILKLAPELIVPALALAVAQGALGLARVLRDTEARSSNGAPRLNTYFYGDLDDR